MRTRKVNADGTYSDYYWVGSTLLAEVQYKANGAFTRTLMFLHDENGAIIGVSVKNAGETNFTSYYYAKNLQGDVVAIYRSDYNSTSQTYYPTLVASYEYDPWGKVISVKGSSGAILSLEAYPNHIAHVNPIRYRGYYYDNETGFYYLQSRYYDPAISRFINADSYGSTGQAFLGTNMFAYCRNCPIRFLDSTGEDFDPIPVGAGVQIEVDLGAYTAGMEVIVFWDVEECENGRPVIAIYSFDGLAFDLTDPKLGSLLITIEDNIDLLTCGTEKGVNELVSILKSGFSVSASGLLIWGNEDFTSVWSYEGAFTAFSASISRVKGAIAWSSSCVAASLGASILGTKKGIHWGVSKTNYTLKGLFQLKQHKKGKGGKSGKF